MDGSRSLPHAGGDGARKGWWVSKYHEGVSIIHENCWGTHRIISFARTTGGGMISSPSLSIALVMSKVAVILAIKYHVLHSARYLPGQTLVRRHVNSQHRNHRACASPTLTCDQNRISDLSSRECQHPPCTAPDGMILGQGTPASSCFAGHQ